MKIKTILSQHRRDFTAIYICEHCGTEKKSAGYDDSNFHQNVIPQMKCANCGKTADKSYRPLTTKYPDYVQI
jgi:transcription elongation factor Elf1